MLAAAALLAAAGGVFVLASRRSGAGNHGKADPQCGPASRLTEDLPPYQLARASDMLVVQWRALGKKPVTATPRGQDPGENGQL
jgi:hypothetical protein